jgi:hypothetical protein
MMLKSSLFVTLLLGAAAAIPISSQASPVIPQSSPAISNIVPAQGYWERCRWLRERIRELEGRLYSAPPWERQRIERRLWERRHEFRESCRRY